MDTAFPLWDRLHRMAIYFDREPFLATSAWATAEGFSSRHSDRLPAVGTPSEGLSWFYSGDWAVGYAGELFDPSPGLAITESLRDNIHYRPQKLRSAYISANVGFASESMLVSTDELSTAFVDPTLCRALGYSIRDWSWVPESWGTLAEPDQIESGYDVVETGDSERISTVLRWHRIRMPIAWNLMSVRVEPSWTGPLDTVASPIHPTATLMAPTAMQQRSVHVFTTAIKALSYGPRRYNFRLKADRPWTSRGTEVTPTTEPRPSEIEADEHRVLARRRGGAGQRFGPRGFLRISVLRGPRVSALGSPLPAGDLLWRRPDHFHFGVGGCRRPDPSADQSVANRRHTTRRVVVVLQRRLGCSVCR